MSWLSSWWQGLKKKGFFISFRLPWPGEKNEPDNLNMTNDDKDINNTNGEDPRKDDL